MTSDCGAVFDRYRLKRFLRMLQTSYQISQSLMELDSKTKAILRYFLRCLQMDLLNQQLLIVLLIAIREVADWGSLTREIGDFIAHPKRDRGLAIDHLHKFNVQTRGVAISAISIPGPFGANELINDLAMLFEKLGFDSMCLKAKTQEMIICYFGILHGSRLQVGSNLQWKLRVVGDWSSDESDSFLSLVAESNKSWSLPLFVSSVPAHHLIHSESSSDPITSQDTLWAEQRDGKLCLAVI